MFRSKDEFKKIYDSMNKNYVESLKEYREYIAKNSSFYITRRKHMKNYIMEKLTAKGYEISEQTKSALMQISRACKIYAIHNQGKDLFEILLLGNDEIMYRYLNAMANLELSKDYEHLLPSIKSDLEILEKQIQEKISQNPIKQASDSVSKNNEGSGR